MKTISLLLVLVSTLFAGALGVFAKNMKPALNTFDRMVFLASMDATQSEWADSVKISWSAQNSDFSFEARGKTLTEKQMQALMADPTFVGHNLYRDSAFGMLDPDGNGHSLLCSVNVLRITADSIVNTESGNYSLADHIAQRLCLTKEWGKRQIRPLPQLTDEEKAYSKAIFEGFQRP